MYEKKCWLDLGDIKTLLEFFTYEHGTITMLFHKSSFLLVTYTQIFVDEIWCLGTCFKGILGEETVKVVQMNASMAVSQ